MSLAAGMGRAGMRMLSIGRHQNQATKIELNDIDVL